MQKKYREPFPLAIQKHFHYNIFMLNMKMNFRTRILVLSFFTGLLGGLVSIAYRWVLETIELGRIKVSSGANLLAIAAWMLAAIIFSLLAEYMVKKEPLISGSGIPQVKAYLINQARLKPLRGILYKFTGGAMGIFNGLSLGREGPSIQLGSLAGQFLGERFGETELERRTLVSAGASVGLAAAFNAPLAGVLFALEELYRNFSPLIILACTLSAATGTLLANLVYGFKPIFPIAVDTLFPPGGYWHLVLLGALCGILGKLFNTLLVSFSSAYERLRSGKILIPTLIAFPLLFVFPLILGGGHRLIEELLSQHYSLWFLGLLLLCKLLFTFASYGTGIPGGIFLPMLSIGAIVGSLYFRGLGTIGGLAPDLEQAFILFGMVGLFTAVVKAPLTGIVLLVEMSRSVPSMLPLAVVAFTAYLTTEILKSDPIYEILLNRMLKKGDTPQEATQTGDRPLAQHTAKQELPSQKIRYGRTLVELYLPPGTAYNGSMLRDIPFPASVRAISLIRGEEEFHLGPDTLLYEGDLLILAADPHDIHAINTVLAALQEKVK